MCQEYKFKLKISKFVENKIMAPKRDGSNKFWLPARDRVHLAVAAVAEGRMNQTEAQRLYNVSQSTISRRLRKGMPAKPRGRTRLFTDKQEQALARRILAFDTRLTNDRIRTMAFEFACENGIEHPFKDNRAGYKWLRGFFHTPPRNSQDEA